MWEKAPIRLPILTKEDAAAARDRMIDEANAIYQRRIAEIEGRAPAKLTKDTRPLLAWQMRQQGKTYKQIGLELGVGVDRVRQLIFRHENALANADKPSSGLSVRARNAIKNENLDANNPAEVAAAGLERFRRIPNLGSKSLADIIRWLREHGHEFAN